MLCLFMDEPDAFQSEYTVAGALLFIRYPLTPVCLSLSVCLSCYSLTLLDGAGLSEEPTLPFSHMLLMLRVPPVGMSATADLGDLTTSLFPCRNTFTLCEKKVRNIDYSALMPLL